jgi:asparagine N-glycosylation enzyme membrane subunit Stt3
MSLENLLAALFVVVILVASVLFALSFFSRSEPEDAAADSPAERPTAEESDTWYFLKFEPGE